MEAPKDESRNIRQLRFQFTLAGSSLVLPYHTLLVVFNLVRNRESNIRFIGLAESGRPGRIH
jgi:hypothetical protein